MSDMRQIHRNATSNTTGSVLPYRSEQIALADGNHTDFLKE